MKSVEEWLKSWNKANVDKIDVEQHLKILRQIQLDAYKAGMSEAAEIVAGFPTTNSTTSQGERDLVMKQAILSARDKKETL